jgi:hypothetical protein
MVRSRTSARLWLAACAILSAAEAESKSLFLSTGGTDGSTTCSRSQPCRNLARAANVAAAGDTVHFLNSGLYGTGVVTIDKSLTISAMGVSATLNPPGGSNAIVINNPNATVFISGLTLQGGGGSIGVAVQQAKSVTLQDSTIQNFGNGIRVDAAPVERLLFLLGGTRVRRNGGDGLIMTPPSSVAILAHVHRSAIEDNGGSGIGISGAAGDTHVAITDSVIAGNSNTGLFLAGGGKVSVARTVVANNGLDGFFQTPNSLISLENVVVRGSGEAGLDVSPGAAAVVSNSTFTNNQVGVTVSGSGQVRTRGNNTIVGNATANVQGALTPLAGQ